MTVARKVTALDLSAVANRGFRDVEGQAEGWTGYGDNEFRGLEPGEFKVGGFHFSSRISQLSTEIGLFWDYGTRIGGSLKRPNWSLGGRSNGFTS